jgi:hypothetical protein
MPKLRDCPSVIERGNVVFIYVIANTRALSSHDPVAVSVTGNDYVVDLDRYYPSVRHATLHRMKNCIVDGGVTKQKLV